MTGWHVIGHVGGQVTWSGDWSCDRDGWVVGHVMGKA